jgi:transcriptional regulator with XRE-family HTH domain
MSTSTDTSRRVAKVVSRSLSEAGIVQRDAAARTGIPMATLGRRLTGHSPFIITELELLAGLLDTTLLDLMAQADAETVTAA